MKERILLIDDDISVTEMLGLALGQAGYQVDVAHSGREGLQRLYEYRPDIVLLDVMMPQMDGWETCRRIRELSDVPILMLTAKSGEENEVRGLKAGADQYAVKPVVIPVLTARVEALVRRGKARTTHAANRRVVVGDLTVDFARQQAFIGDSSLELSPTEYRLLACLASKPGEVIPRAQLLTDVWGPEYRGEDLYLKLYICYLRQKIEPNPSNPQYIITRRGVGYYLNDAPAGRNLWEPIATDN